jgi:hypothetical protein
MAQLIFGIALIVFGILGYVYAGDICKAFAKRKKN